MLKKVLLLVGLMTVYSVMAAPAARPRPYLTLTATVLNPAPAVGDKIDLKVYSKARPPYYFHATRLFIYRKDAVKGMVEQSDLKLIKHKSAPGYDSLEILPWDWFKRQPEAEVVRSFPTDKWLPGRYTIHVHTLYYPKEGSKGYIFSATKFEMELKPKAAVTTGAAAGAAAGAAPAETPKQK